MIRIVESNYITGAVKKEQYPDQSYSDFAFVGRSNVGKSSMINTLLNFKGMAKISGRPGKTRIINFFQVRFKDSQGTDGFFNCVDLPGYGFAKVAKAEMDLWKKMIEEYLSSRTSLKGVVVLIDVRHDADPKDKAMLSLLRAYSIPTLVIATKADKLGKNQVAAQLKKLAAEHGLPFVYPFSSLRKTGLENLLNWLESSML